MSRRGVPRFNHETKPRCPCCKSTSITLGNRLVTRNSIPAVPATCDDCGKQWDSRNTAAVREVTFALANRKAVA